MGFMAFLKFALIFFDALAWPLFALGYPLRASIEAIEANSNSDTQKIVTYWVIFSLISLFEVTFMGLLQWLPFWPYLKLTIVCWLMIPGFDGAFYVYNHFVHPCLYMDVQTIINWFKKRWDFLLKDSFLANGPEALQKLIETEAKGRELSMLQKDIKPVQVMEEKEIASSNAISETEPEPIVSESQAKMLAVAYPESKAITTCWDPSLPEIPNSDQKVQKEWTCALCLVTASSEQNLKMHLRGLRHRAACVEMMKAKKAKANSLASPREKRSNIPPGQQIGNKNLPFRCTLCNIGCTRSEDLNSHIWGKKHLARIEELNSNGVGVLGTGPPM